MVERKISKNFYGAVVAAVVGASSTSAVSLRPRIWVFQCTAKPALSARNAAPTAASCHVSVGRPCQNRRSTAACRASLAAVARRFIRSVRAFTATASFFSRSQASARRRRSAAPRSFRSRSDSLSPHVFPIFRIHSSNWRSKSSMVGFPGPGRGPGADQGPPLPPSGASKSIFLSASYCVRFEGSFSVS